jgi:hypothetical protein
MVEGILMCLIRSKSKTNRLRKQLIKKKEVKFYKVLHPISGGALISPFYLFYQWSPGLNKADGEQNWTGNVLEGGAIHVSRTLRRARRWQKFMGLRTEIYEVYGKLPDFIAAGDRHDAAFTQVWLGDKVE